VLSGYAARVALGVHLFAVGAAMPGLGGVIGLRQFERAAQLRREILTLTWLFITAVSATMLLWNRSFLTLWVGPGNYAGPWVNLLIVCTMAQTAFVRSDAYVIDATLQPRQRVLVAGIAAALTIGLATLLSIRFGTVGLCLGILAGRLAQSIAYPHLVHTYLGAGSWSARRALARPFVAMILIFATCAVLGDRIVTRHWLVWVGGVAATSLALLGMALVTGLPAEARTTVLRRGRELARRLT